MMMENVIVFVISKDPNVMNAMLNFMISLTVMHVNVIHMEQ
jgi:hypothetical protein